MENKGLAGDTIYNTKLFTKKELIDNHQQLILRLKVRSLINRTPPANQNLFSLFL